MNEQEIKEELFSWLKCKYKDLESIKLTKANNFGNEEMDDFSCKVVVNTPTMVYTDIYQKLQDPKFSLNFESCWVEGDKYIINYGVKIYDKN